MPVDLLAGTAPKPMSADNSAKMDTLYGDNAAAPVDLLAKKAAPVNLLDKKPEPTNLLAKKPEPKNLLADTPAKEKGFVEQREDDILGAAKDTAIAGVNDITSPFRKNDYKPTDFDKAHPIIGPFLHGAAQPFRPLMGIGELEGSAAVGALEGVTKPIERATGIPSWISDTIGGIASPAMAKRAMNEVIESAAIKDNGQIYKGVSHDEIRKTMPEGSNNGADADTGFVTKKGNFISRQDALELAKKNGQLKGEPKIKGELHSEDIGQPKPKGPTVVPVPLQKNKIVAEKVGDAVDKVTGPFKRIFNPAGVSEGAGRTAAIKRQVVGEATRDTAASTAAMEPHRERMGQLTPQERNDVIDHMEGRKAAPADPALAAAAKVLKGQYGLRADKIPKTKSLAKTNLIKDYMARSFVGTEEQKAAMVRGMGKQGSGKNLFKRGHLTYQDAEAAAKAAGMKPKFDNFIDQANDYNQNMDMYIAHNRAFDMLHEENYIKYFLQGGKVPEGWVPLEGRMTTKTGVDKKSGAPVTVNAYAPEDVARVYNNFISKGLGGDVGAGMKTAQQVFNNVSQLKLGLANVYHAGITGTAAISSDLARGTRQILKGEPLKGAKTVGLAPFAPYRVAAAGSKFNKQWLRITDYGHDVEKLVDTATRANLIQNKRPSYMDTAGAKSFKELFSEAKTKPLTGSAKIVGEGIGTALQKISGPMFDKWIPNMKRGVTIERLQQFIKEHPNSTDDEQMAYARTLGDSVDNRFGEMMRDNLFWNKTLRDGMQLGFLSYSWVAGATRMIGGAAKEGAATLYKGKELGPNAEYLMANAVTASILNSVYQYVHTGQGPSSAKDLFFPKTGGTQQVGKDTVDERAVLPTGHWTQIAEYMHDGLAELYNEGNIGAKVVYDAMRNRDYRDMPIAKPWSQWSPDMLNEVPDALWRYGKFLLGQAVTPIAIQSYNNRNAGTGIKPAETVLTAARPAPAFISDTDGVKRMQAKADGTLWKKKLKSDQRLDDRRESNQPPAEAPAPKDLLK